MSGREAGVVIRRSTARDAGRLAEIDALTWSSASTPQTFARAGRGFTRPDFDPDGVLVAVVDGVVVGYVELGHPTTLESNRHVLEVQGLAVVPEWQRRGIARMLLEAAVAQARERGARRLTLRVLAGNEPARRLYAAHGFEVEGTLREEFLIDGRYVDDMRMALRL